MSAQKNCRRSLLVLAFASLLASCNSLGSWWADAPVDHGALLTIDSHVDIPLDFATETVDPGVAGEAQVDLTKMAAGNLNSVFFVVYVGQVERTEQSYALARDQASQKFDAIHRMTQMYPERISLATSSQDVHRIHQAGKLVALIGVENGFSFGEDLSLVEDYYEHGMRYAGFAHFGHSNFADSSGPRADLGDADEEHGGLSDLGRGLLDELNRLGVMADVSHSSKKTTLEVAARSSAPVIASHSAVYALNPIARNLSDEEMLAIKKTGGVVQIVAYDTYLKDPPAEKKIASAALREDYNVSSSTWAALSMDTKKNYQTEVALLHERWPRATLEDFVAHINYAVQLIGIEHVGMASDFGGGGGVDGWANASETENVTRQLIANGYSKSDIEKLWGGNLLRVMGQAEAHAKILKAPTE